MIGKVDEVVVNLNASIREQETDYWQSVLLDCNARLLMKLQGFEALAYPSGGVDVIDDDDGVKRIKDKENEGSQRSGSSQGMFVTDEKLKQMMKETFIELLENLPKHCPKFTQMLEIRRTKQAQAQADALHATISQVVMDYNLGDNDAVSDHLGGGNALEDVNMNAEPAVEDTPSQQEFDRLACEATAIVSQALREQAKQRVVESVSTRKLVEVKESASQMEFDQLAAEVTALVSQQMREAKEKEKQAETARMNALVPVKDSEPQQIAMVEEEASVITTLIQHEGKQRKSKKAKIEAGSSVNDATQTYARITRKGPAVCSPFDHGAKRGSDYDVFMDGDTKRNVGIGQDVSASWFAAIENASYELQRDHMEAYLCCLNSFPEFARIKHADGVVVTSVEFLEKMTEIFMNNGTPSQAGTTFSPFKEEVVAANHLSELAKYILGEEPKWSNIEKWPPTLNSVVTVVHGLDGWLACEFDLSTCEILVYDS